MCAEPTQKTKHKTRFSPLSEHEGLSSIVQHSGERDERMFVFVGG